MKLNVATLRKAMMIVIGIFLILPVLAGATERVVVGELITSTS